jgi:outer membrane protein assembly factor BamD (BamD/ComL family)
MMSITGIASSILTAFSGTQGHQSRSQQIQSEFQQLGQDLQSGNLTQAQSDFTTLSQNLPGLSQNSAAATTANTSTSTNPVAQAFAQLGQDLQSGNLQGAQQDLATVQQDLQNAGQQVGGHHHHHHHHHAVSSQNSNLPSSQQTNSIDQAFGQLEQTLQSGNLQGAQSAFSTIVNDLQNIGGFTSAGSSSTSASAGSLNVTA